MPMPGVPAPSPPSGPPESLETVVGTLREAILALAGQWATVLDEEGIATIGQILHLETPGASAAPGGARESNLPALALLVYLNGLILVVDALPEDAGDQWRALAGGQLRARATSPGFAIYEAAARVDALLTEQTPTAAAFFTRLWAVARAIRASPHLDQDLYGRVYQDLLASDLVKHTSTFYTSVPSARLLARLVVGEGKKAGKEVGTGVREGARGPERIGTDARAPNPARPRPLPSMCDFTCGSGTLLVAAYHALRDRVFLGAKKEKTALESFFREFVERACHGFDASYYAVLMAQGTLLSLAPSVQPARLHVSWEPLRAGDPPRLGSLAFLDPARPPRATRDGFDLVIMNPPFARSCGDNLLFGNLPRADRRALAGALRALRTQVGGPATGQAGQAADFLHLAVRQLAPGGHVGIVLPKSVTCGSSWEATREFLARAGHIVEHVVFSYHAPTFAFSEHTHFSECLLVVRKGPGAAEHLVRVTNFLAWPASTVRARDAPGPYQPSPIQATEGTPGPTSPGVRYAVPQAALATHARNWNRVLGFYNPRLAQICLRLIEGHAFQVSSETPPVPVPLVPLHALGRIGYDRAQVTRGTKVDPAPGLEPVETFWGRDNAEIETIRVEPSGARHADGTQPKFSRSRSHVLLPETTFLTTTKLFTLFCTRPVLSNVFWTFVPDSGLCSADGQPVTRILVEKVLSLWGNTSLGILLLLGNRQETRGPWVHWKKHALQEWPVPDFTRLSEKALGALERLWTRHADATHPGPYLDRVASGGTLVLDRAVLEAVVPASAHLSRAELTRVLRAFYPLWHTPGLAALGLP